MSIRRETVAALLSPPGRGAVATVVVEGPNALAVVAAGFVPAVARPLDQGDLGAIRLGRWGGPTGEAVVVCRTSPERIEIHCHGGAAAPKAILDALVAARCIAIDWKDWIARDVADPIVAEAIVDLARAPTERTAAILLDQAQGALSRAIGGLRRRIENGNLSDAESLTGELLARASLGAHLVHPWRVVLAGRPNVGKSSLVNALAGYERAIVHAAPGTTRDVVTVEAAIDGWPVELSDTAGLRQSDDPIETAGVAAALTRRNEADLVVLVFDASVPWTDDDTRLASELPQAVVVHNKSDLVGELSGGTLASGRPPGVATSATTDQGIDRLLRCVGERLASAQSPTGAAVPFRTRHAKALGVVQDALANGDANTAIAQLAALVERSSRASSPAG